MYIELPLKTLLTHFVVIMNPWNSPELMILQLQVDNSIFYAR